MSNKSLDSLEVEDGCGFNYKLWEEKLRLLYEAGMKYYVSIVATDFVDLFKLGNFSELMIKGLEIIDRPSPIDFTDNEKEMYFSNRNNLNIKEMFNAEVVNKILAFDYSPPNNYETIIDHFVYLYTLCCIPSKYYSEIDYRLLDLSIIKYIGFINNIINNNINNGTYLDKIYLRNKSIRNQKRKKEYEDKIIDAYNILG